MTADEKILFNVNNSPHIRHPDDTPAIMRTVCLALVPAFLWALVMFGWYSMVPVISCVVACVATEWLIQRWRGMKPTVNDWSAVVTGLLLAAVCPPNLPAWAAAVGGVFAIAIAKQAFGGLGHNIWNPALLARAFMQASMPERINSGEWPFLSLAGKWWNNLVYTLSGSFADINNAIKASPDATTGASAASATTSSGVDVMTSATILEKMHSPAATVVTDWAGNVSHELPEGLTPAWEDIFRSFFGVEGGSLGEISAFLLILGGLYLLWKKIITWEIPVLFIATAVALGWILPQPYKVEGIVNYTPWFQGPWLAHLAAGGLCWARSSWQPTW